MHELEQAGALLYFPIHYAGVTVFQSTRDVEMELLTRDYNRSLECRGQANRPHCAVLQLLVLKTLFFPPFV